MSVPLTSHPTTQNSMAVQLRPAQMCFEVEEVKIVGKVNEVDQYLFKVNFHPSGHPSTNGTDRYTATVPVHAPTLTKALMILQAYGESIRSKTPEQFRNMRVKPIYSAVEIESGKVEGGYSVKFTEYNEKIKRFQEKAHISREITPAVYQDLERYATALASNPIPLEPDTLVTPSVTLEHIGSDVSAHITPTVDLTVVSEDDSSLQQTEDRKKKLKETFDLHKQVIAAMCQSKREATQKEEESITAMNELFGEQFASEVHKNGLTAKNLVDAALQALVKKQEGTEERTKALLQQLMLLIQNKSKTTEETYLEQFNHLVDTAIEWMEG